jgi:hypothetical protein
MGGVEELGVEELNKVILMKKSMVNAADTIDYRPWTIFKLLIKR